MGSRVTAASLKAPFPWFGGKSKAAPLVWDLLGDPAHYVEPFAGSCAVLLGRPLGQVNRACFSETVNDFDGLLVNVWRSIQMHPHETAEAASWPVTEADMHARHVALVRWRDDRQLEHLMGDPEWCDPRMAGWWLYCVCAWIGSGWCYGDNGPWWPDGDGRLTKQPQPRKHGVKRQRPHLSGNGMGVHHAGLREQGVGAPHEMTMPGLLDWFGLLSARLRHVRIVNGDWARVCTGGAINSLSVRGGDGYAGIFLDPPYADTAGRADGLYAIDSLDVAHAVAEWCLQNGDNPDWRIVLAGFDGEHGSKLTDAGWSTHEWFVDGYLTGGMGNEGHQQKLERLWASPACVVEPGLVQSTLF